jgi:integrase
LLFPSTHATPKSPRNFESEFSDHREKAGLPGELTFHLLRHTTASWLDAVGATEVTKKAILGHERHDVTEHYTHARVDEMRRALVELERRYLRSEQWRIAK